MIEINFNKMEIKGQNYIVKETIRGYIYFEEMNQKSFTLESLMDKVSYFYCVLLANNEDFPYGFEEFMSCLDDDSTLLPQFFSIIMNGKEVESKNNEKKLNPNLVQGNVRKISH